MSKHLDHLEPERTIDIKCESCKGRGSQYSGVVSPCGIFREEMTCEDCEGLGWVSSLPLTREEWEEKYGAKHE